MITSMRLILFYNSFDYLITLLCIGELFELGHLSNHHSIRSDIGEVAANMALYCGWATEINQSTYECN